MLFSCTKDNLHDNIVSMKYQAIAADEASNFFSSTSSKELFAKTKNNLDLKIDNASLSCEYIENTSLAMPVFKATTKYTKMSTQVFLVKVEDVILPFLFNRIADEKAQTKEFSGIIIISELNGDFVNGYKVINGVFISQFIKNTNSTKTSKTAYAPCGWECLSESWQELNEVVISNNYTSPSFDFGPRGLTSTSFSSDISQIGTSSGSSSGSSSGDITSVPFFPCDDPLHGCDNDYVDEEEDRIFNELTGKALCVYNKLNSSSSGFADAIKKFDGEFPVSHISLKINNALPLGTYGITNPPSNFNITVELSNTQLNNISDLGGAIAISHEIIHAEIFRKLLSAAQKGDLNTNNYTTEENINFVNSLRDNFPGLYDYYYARAHPDYNHNLMAQHYRSTIADIAQTFDNNTFPRQIYEDLAWAGLRVIDENTNSIAWNNLTTEEQERIKSNLLNIFHNGTKNCN
jgi:hypothetical protein